MTATLRCSTAQARLVRACSNQDDDDVAEHEPCIGETSEWFTPPQIFTALRLTFDLDPCSPGPAHWVPAKQIYTRADDGLKQDWGDALVFMNPPFGGRNGHVPWLRKFFAHGNGIAIVRAYTSSAWWHAEMPKAQMILFPKGKTVPPGGWHDRHGTGARRRASRHGRRRLRGADAIGARNDLGPEARLNLLADR